MIIDTLFFYFFALLTLAGAILTITRRNPVHSAISLIVSLVGVAGLYLLQQAEFLFAVQIILYVGGVMVLFLFVIMLVNLNQVAHEREFNKQWWLAVASLAAVGAEVVYFLRKGGAAFRLENPPAMAVAAEGNVQTIAKVLFEEYLLPFEVASLLLLAAIVGGVIMAKKRI